MIGTFFPVVAGACVPGGACMEAEPAFVPMHILFPSDVFPPGSVGGAAWSAHTLAHALCNRGQHVTVVVPVPGQPALHDMPSGDLPVLHWRYRAPRLPFVQNYVRHEWLWQPLADLLTHLGATSPCDRWLIHAQHVQTTPAAVLAGQRLGVPVVATVRDHWPWDYFATGLHGNRLPYPQMSWAGLATDLPARLGAVPGVLAWAAIPYILAHVRRRAAFLARADAVIAVSQYIARRLEAIVPPERIQVIPNMVDCLTTEKIAAMPPETPLPERFMLFVGKLERNKGAGLLVTIFRALQQAAALDREMLPTLLIAGSGALQAEIERDLAKLGVPTYFLAWAPHDEVLRLMARCELLLFPSVWGEPLSRVLLEASMLGAPILAMPTGGTPDILTDGVNGALAATPDAFAHRMALLLRRPEERRRLGEQARHMARQRFAVEVVAPQVEELYAQVLQGKRGT